MYKVMRTFVCKGCVNPVTGTERTSVDIGVNANLELVDKFCDLGHMLSVNRDADAAMETRIQVVGMRLCLGQGADLHMAQLMPQPFTIS